MNHNWYEPQLEFISNLHHYNQKYNFNWKLCLFIVFFMYKVELHQLSGSWEDWNYYKNCALRCVMCHESPCHIKNNVPHIYRRCSVKKFSRLVSSKSAELTSKILSCVGQSCLYNCSCSSRSLPSQERIFEVNSADFEDTNLENFFR